MRIYLKEIKDTPSDLHFDQSEAWVRETVMQADESPVPANRPIQFDLMLHKVDAVVVMKGKLVTEVKLLCSRCTNVIDYAVKESFSSLFCQDPELAGVAHLGGKDQETPVGQIHGYARNHRETVGKKDPEMDITYLAEDYIDLSGLLSEQLHLQIPVQPLCREDCQGICMTCGADLNKGRCACSKIRKDNPFSILKDLKLQ